MSEGDVVDDEVPIIEEGMETMDLAEEVEIEIEDPLDVALARAETAEKEIDKVINRVVLFILIH